MLDDAKVVDNGNGLLMAITATFVKGTQREIA